MTFQAHPSVDAVLSSSAPAATRAHRALLDAIVSGATPPGELLTEGEVSVALGMSRTPVREAFLELERESMLRLYPKRGAIVSHLDERGLRELLDTRFMFESTAAGWIAARHDDRSELDTALLDAALQEALAKQRVAAPDDDALAFSAADHLFHELVVAAAGNPLTTRLFGLTGPLLQRAIHSMVSRGSDVRMRVIDEHAHLASLLVAGDGAGYRDALTRHIGEHFAAR